VALHVSPTDLRASARPVDEPVVFLEWPGPEAPFRRAGARLRRAVGHAANL